MSAINTALNGRFTDGYGNYPTLDKLYELTISLPTKNNKIDCSFMEEFVAELQAARVAELQAARVAELQAYLTTSGLSDYQLTAAEHQVLQDFNDDKFAWDLYNLETLFGKSTRGKRLKSDDRVPGTLPFVTAGEAEEGVSAYIGNPVTVFSENTVTIDMFGSAKYRNYKYGGDDHVAIVHTENLPKMAAVFTATAIHKSSHNGQFDYSKNFYAKDADELTVALPTKNNQPDFATMETLISAVQKLVIQGVVDYADQKIHATQAVIRPRST